MWCCYSTVFSIEFQPANFLQIAFFTYENNKQFQMVKITKLSISVFSIRRADLKELNQLYWYREVCIWQLDSSDPS